MTSPIAARSELLRFAVVGGLNTLGGLGLILTLQTWLSPSQANVAGYLLCTPIAFASHRRITFRHGGATLPAAARFLVTAGAGFLSNWLVLHASLAAGAVPALSQVLATAAHAVTLYLLSRSWVFTRG